MDEIWGIVGGTGFVGQSLRRQRAFQSSYNSKNIGDISGQSFDVLVCAAAPATMWAANKDPDGDTAKLNALFESLRSAKAGKLVLISTVAVYDDTSAGYTESSGSFEQAKAYGRNRRMLENRVQDAFEDVLVLRLPALFGTGLKKNFIFDLINPIPSFINPNKFEEVTAAFSSAETRALEAGYVFDDGLHMWALKRAEIAATPIQSELEEAFHRIGFVAKTFTNSESTYQFYNMDHLADDIDRCRAHGLSVLNICSDPVRVGDIHQHLIGSDFENSAPARVTEDVRTEHAGLLGGSGPYLYDREQVLSDLKTFYTRERGE